MREVFSWIEKYKLKRVHVLRMNAESMGLPNSSFDVVLCGFMGWNYCFDFALGEFKRADARMKEIGRVLRAGGRVWISAWEGQGDLDWMEESLVRYLPSILSDPEFIEDRPIGYSKESAAGYDIILRNAGFKDIDILHEQAEFVSASEEEWWDLMNNLGWRRYLAKLENVEAERLQTIKQALFNDLQCHKRVDGIYFAQPCLPHPTSELYGAGECRIVNHHSSLPCQAYPVGSHA